MTNPWLVDSIEDFYFLKCPECNFDSKEETNFQIHAVENHPLSFAFFGKTEVENIENMLDVSITEGDETDIIDVAFVVFSTLRMWMAPRPHLFWRKTFPK